MWSQRDRLLGILFAVQLAGAMIFGLVLMNQVGGDEPTTVAIADGAGGAPATVSPDDGAASSGVTGGAGATDAATASVSDAGAVSAGSGAGNVGAADTTGDTSAPDPAAPTAAATPTGGSAAAPAPGGDGRPADETRVGITADEILVGVLVTQTGAINFRSSAQATKSYFDMLNEQGGINGRRVKYIIRDDGLDKNKGLQAVQEMIDAGVFAFVGFNAPQTEQSIVPVLERNEIPLIGAFAIPPTPYGYMFSAPYETYGRVGGRTLAEQGITTPALVFISNQNEETDRIIADSWKAGLAEKGVTLDDANVFPVDVTKTSFDDVVTQMRFNGVDGIGTILESTAMVRLQQSMNRAGMHVPHVSSPFGGDPAVAQNPNVGSSFEGTLVLSDVHFLGSSAPAMQQYESEVKRRFGDQAELNWAGQHGWLGAHMFTQVMTSLGDDPTREALLEGMNSLTDFDSGFTVPLTITSDPQTHAASNTCMKVGKVTNGKVALVADWTCPELTMGGDGVG